CARLGLEGLDDDDSSDCEDDSEYDSPGASDGSCPSGSRYNENAGNSNECSSSSVDSVEDSPATSAAEKPVEQPEGTGRDLQGEAHTGGQPEIPADENSKITKPLKEEVQEKSDVTQVQEKSEVTQALKEEEQENTSSKAQETNQLQSTEAEPIDLLAFNSAAELEALGLDKLKMELMSLGLKCGGTLKERAARLFSVRGLSRDQIDPALFAKPSKGKKK
ncbi:SDE2 regulator, partial [Pluvianellus socialis]|nr:SDE2 regulator [Pluvianellus socialis]